MTQWIGDTKQDSREVTDALIEVLFDRYFGKLVKQNKTLSEQCKRAIKDLITDADCQLELEELYKDELIEWFKES